MTPSRKAQAGRGKREARTMEIRIIDHMPINPKTGMGKHSTRRFVSLNVSETRLSGRHQLQHIAFVAKMALARANQKTRRPR